MILDLPSLEGYILEILILFKNFAFTHDLSLEVLNLYNHPYLPSTLLSLEDKNSKNLLLVNFLEFSHLGPRELRSGSFFNNVNELSLYFNLFYISRENKDAYKTSIRMYTLFNDFLDQQTFVFSKDKDRYYKVNIKVFIYQMSNLGITGKLNNFTKYGSTMFSSFATFSSTFCIKETKLGGIDATRYN